MNIAILGFTGLIGQDVLALLYENQKVETIVAIGRNRPSMAQAKIRYIPSDLKDESLMKEAMRGCQAVIISIGTTRNKVKGNMDEYRKIDFDIPVRAARWAFDAGVSEIYLISAIGASSQSSNFYLKMKGEVEDIICKLSFQSIHIFRPSLLLGARKEFRAGEKLASWIMRIFAPMIPSRYKAIPVKLIARAIQYLIMNPVKGKHIYSFEEIKRLASR